MLELTDSIKLLLTETANNLKGHQRRRFMAQTYVQDKSLEKSLQSNTEKGFDEQ